MLKLTKVAKTIRTSLFLVLSVILSAGVKSSEAEAQMRPTSSRAISIEAASIDQQQTSLQHQERILDIGEGADIDAYLEDGHYKKIVAEELSESAYVIRTFYFVRDELVEAQVKVIGYPSYPMPSKDGDTHEHLKIGKNDKVLSDDIYYFMDGELIRWQSSGKVVLTRDLEFEAKQQDIPGDALSYRTLMSTPSPAGSEPEDAWICAAYKNHGEHCDSYIIEPQP